MAISLAGETGVAVGDSVGVTLSAPATLAGDQIVLVYMIYAPASTSDVEVPEVVGGFSEPGSIQIDITVDLLTTSPVSEGGVVVGWAVVASVYVPDATVGTWGSFAVEAPASADLTNGISVMRAIVVRGAVEGAPESVVAGPYTTANGATAALDLGASSHTAFHLPVSTGTGSDGDVPNDYESGTRAQTSSLIGAWFQSWRRTAATGGSEAALVTSIVSPATSGETGAYWIFGLVFTPTAIALPVADTHEPERLALDCADSYEVMITGTDYDTVLAQVGWATIEWSRVLDEISSASVTIPDRLGGVHCVADLGGLRPWRHGIKIERNGWSVWRGPVTKVIRRGDAIQVQAEDVFARFRKRLATRTDVSFSNEDVGSVFALMLGAAQFSVDPWVFSPPVATTGQFITRDFLYAEFERSFDVITDLADTAVDYYVLNGALVVRDLLSGWIHHDGADNRAVLEGPYSAANEMFYGLFTEQSWSQRPDWSINGDDQSNAFWVLGPDAGEEGTRRWWVAQDAESQGFEGVLDEVDTNPLYRPEEGVIIPDAAFQMRADSGLALRVAAPAVIEGGALALGAPVNAGHLRPGSLWLCDIYDAGYGQLLQVARLKRVQVSVSVDDEGVKETVSPTLQPPGQET